MNTEHADIIDKIKSFVQQSTYADLEKIQNNTLLFKEGYFDSMGFISLIAFIEEEFDIKTVDADLIEENFESIDAIAGFIGRKSN